MIEGVLPKQIAGLNQSPTNHTKDTKSEYQFPTEFTESTEVSEV
ncbi:MAG TPA: hypothetical protein VFT72_17405 [Opitutaceae bacterium]|nr:hypothetical protein [Opitutaceae bacterium]